jgi:hypothetical protein
MYGHGHYYCQSCGHAVSAQYGGCRSCRTPLADLMMLDVAMDEGLCGDGVGFDPFDGEFAFNIPGTDLAVEPGGQIDIDMGGMDFPV